MSIGSFPEIAGQQILVGIILEGRLGVFGAEALQDLGILEPYIYIYIYVYTH